MAFLSRIIARLRGTGQGETRIPWIHQALLLAGAGALYVAADLAWDLPPTGLVFHEGRIEAIPDGESLRFDCRFVFLARHQFKKSYEIAFPTRIGADGPIPDEIEIRADGRPLEFVVVPDGFIFDLPVTPGGRTDLRIDYRIAAPARRGVYVTRTARLWPKPPARAVFILPSGARSNYHSDGAVEIAFEPFVPEADWEVEWP